MNGINGLLNLLTWVEHRKLAQASPHEENGVLCPIPHPTQFLPSDSSKVIASTVSCRKVALSREVAARYTAHADDSYVTVITLNRREPICMFLNARMLHQRRNEARGESSGKELW